MELKKMKNKEVVLVNQVMELQKEVNRLKKEVADRTDSYFGMVHERDRYLRYAMALEKKLTENNIPVSN